MPIFELHEGKMKPVAETTFSSEGLKERTDLQRLLRDHIEVISPDTMVLAEEYGEWEDSSRRIDLLGLDREANLVVVELKRSETGGHMELQAIRYAAMVSEMTFDQAVEAHAAYLSRRQQERDARAAILDFLEWDEPDEDHFAQTVRIVLASAEFSKEVTTAVLWLNQSGLDIRCVRLRPYKIQGQIVVDVQQVIPLPEATEYQVRARAKAQLERASREGRWDEPRLMKAIEAKRGPVAMRVAKDILDWVQSRASRVWWGKGAQSGSFIPVWDMPEDEYIFFSVRSEGVVEVLFYWMSRRAPFSDDPLRRELLERLNRIPQCKIPESALGGKPKFPLDLLGAKESLDLFKDTIEWAVKRADVTSKDVGQTPAVR